MNTYPTLPLPERLEELERFEKLMLNSGYSWSQIQEVMRSGLVGFERKGQEAKHNNTAIH